MEKITKEKTPIVNIMNLYFFARHFEFPIESLQWGIVKIITDCETIFDCAVLVEGICLYIDISHAKIRPCVNLSAAQFELMPCKVSESEDDYLFTTNKIELSINKKGLAQSYADKVYSTETTKYLLGGFTPW